ncbi:MAG: hypothetical protein AABZ08_03545 [Planctomycetota bacterium]
MSPNMRMLISLACAGPCAVGCNWLVAFFPFEQCEPRPVLVALAPDSSDNVAATPVYHSTAGCTIIIDVKQGSIFTDDDSKWWTPYDPYDPISGQEYEVWVEPLEPDGRVETGVLGSDGRVTIPTSEGHTSVTLTVYLPDDRAEDGVDEETVIIQLDSPTAP